MKRLQHLRLITLLVCGLSVPAFAQDEAVGDDDAAASADDGAAILEDAAPEADAAVDEAPAAQAPEPEKSSEAIEPKVEGPAAKKAKSQPKPVAVEEGDDEEEEAPPAAQPKQAATGSDSGAPAPAEAGSGEAPLASGSATDLEKRGPFDFISEGKRLELKDGDISIEPPTGWEVYTKEPGLTLMTMPPRDPKFKYQRTIQIAAFEGPRYMDEITAKEYEEEIPRKFQAISNAIVDYKLRNHIAVEMEDSRQGLLFYTEFKLDNVPLMQAHIVVSSATNHYLLTYTDVAQHFEDDADSQFLTEAWASMTSVQLKGRTPMRYTSSIALGSALVGLVLLCVAIYFFRNWRAKRAYAFYGSGKGLDDVDLKSDVGSQIVSKMPGEPAQSGVSGMTFVDEDDEKIT